MNNPESSSTSPEELLLQTVLGMFGEKYGVQFTAVEGDQYTGNIGNYGPIPIIARSQDGNFILCGRLLPSEMKAECAVVSLQDASTHGRLHALAGKWYQEEMQAQRRLERKQEAEFFDMVAATIMGVTLTVTITLGTLYALQQTSPENMERRFNEKKQTTPDVQKDQQNKL